MNEMDHKNANKSYKEAVKAIEFQVKITESIISEITIIKASYNKMIQETKDFLNNNIKALRTYKIKDNKKKELKKCLRRLKEYWNEVKKADHQVKEAMDKMLEYRNFEDVLKDGLEKHNEETKTTIMHNFEKSLFMRPSMSFLRENTNSQSITPVSVFFQMDVFNLLRSFLFLHQSITSFLFHQADIVCIMESDSLKRNITLNEFVSKIFGPKLTRERCAEIIKEKLIMAGIRKIPFCSILKQLSSWNVYIASNKEKGTKPLPDYEIKRLQSEKEFEKWVINTYLPDFRKRHKSKRDPLKYASSGKEAQKKAALQQHEADCDKNDNETD